MAAKKKAKPKSSKPSKKSSKAPAKVARFEPGLIFQNLLKLETWLDSKKLLSDLPGIVEALVVYSNRDWALDNFKSFGLGEKEFASWKKSDAVSEFSTSEGNRYLARPVVTSEFKEQEGLALSPYAAAREVAGDVVRRLVMRSTAKAVVDLRFCEPDEARGFLVGLEIANYRFKDRWQGFKPSFQLSMLLPGDASEQKEIFESARALAMSVNTARHLTNLPPEVLHPISYAGFVKSVFAKSKKTSVDIWDEKKLKAEGMGLLSAVGQGSPHAPRLVHIRYRPKSKTETPVYAFIGKGVTFDTGGLDIKGADSMRWMKKDMAGSASVLGLVLWADQIGYGKAFDAYLALAENSVSGDSFAPGDIIQSRSGKTVEVHNTDAEGRLVMADALEVARETKPLKGLIDVSTLTGAIKVALGPDIPGLFSNNSELSGKLVKSGSTVGEPVWPMPLAQSYRGKLKSTFADMINAADGFGGAVTAALFLQSFAEPLPWAHLDIYGWRDGMGGAYSEMGGNGQSVQLLAELLNSEL